MGDGDVNGERSDAKSDRGEGSAKCPECGSARSERTPAVPQLVRHRVKFKLSALLIVLGFIVWKNVGVWPPMGPPQTSNSFSAGLLNHKYTRSTLEQYASGEIADGQLVDDIMWFGLPGTWKLEAGFHSPKGTLVTVDWHGWPTVIVLHQYQADYDDVYEKTNPTPAGTPTLNGWKGTTYIRQAVDSQGRFTHFAFTGMLLATPVAIVVIAFACGRVLRSVLIALHLAQRDQTRLRDRLVRLLPFICALLCIIGIAIGSLPPGPYPDRIIPANTAIASTSVDLTNLDIARLQEAPAGEAEIARAILDATSGMSTAPDDALAIGWKSDSGSTSTGSYGGWSEFCYYDTNRDANLSAGAKLGRPRFELRRNYAMIDLYIRWGDPMVRLDTITILPHAPAKMLLSLFAAWWTPAMAAALAHWWVRRRAKKRATRGECVRCGYDLKGL